MLKHVIVILTLSTAGLVASPTLATSKSTVAPSDSPVAGSVLLDGRWKTPKDDSIVEITTKDGTSVGTLVASSNKKAPIGTVLLRNLKKRSDNAWKGKIYSPRHDRTMGVTLALEGDKLKLKVSAGLMTKTVYWTRAR